MQSLICLLAAGALALAPVRQEPRTDSNRKPAVPVDAVEGIINAFKTHSLVALSDAHGNEQAQAFLISLVRDPRFAATVNDVIVEFGNARYQDVIDRWVRGEDVPYATLRHVWEDTTQPSASNDRPINEAFFRAVRAVNVMLPKDRQIRVLLGDPPIDWDAIRSREEHFKWIEMRETHPAALIQIEVLAKRRKALLVYGHGHFMRQSVYTNYAMDDWRAQTIVSLIERSSPTRVFTIYRDANIGTLQADVSSWRMPSIALLRGTTVGAEDFTKFFEGAGTRFGVRDGKIVQVPRAEWRSLRAEEQIDAVLYLGPPSSITTSGWTPELCADKVYVEMRLKRIALAGLPPGEAEHFKKHCASLTAK
jgi:hypothetical protein